MQNAMFSGLFAALSSETRMNIISNNMANVSTTGYKQDRVAFKDTMLHFAHDYIREPLENLRSDPMFPEAQLRSRTRVAVSSTDFTQGSMIFTGNSFDIAIAGEGFFRVETPQGEFLTRDGCFCQSSDGTLVTKQGYQVLGEGGPISIPQGTTNVNVNSEGRVFADGAEVGQIAVVGYDNLNALEKVGNNLYRLQDGATANETEPLALGTLVNQGYLEGANVNPVTEMVNMIEVQRSFEAAQKMMQASDAIDREVTTRVGRPK